MAGWLAGWRRALSLSTRSIAALSLSTTLDWLYWYDQPTTSFFTKLFAAADSFVAALVSPRRTDVLPWEDLRKTPECDKLLDYHFAELRVTLKVADTHTSQ